jgi:O-antigen ligase
LNSEAAPGAPAHPADHLRAFTELLDGLPPNHPRVIGRWLLRFGMGAMLSLVCTGPAAPNICLAVAALGCLLARPPLYRLAGLAWGLLFFIWVGISAIIAAQTGFVAHPMIGLGLLYTWVVLFLGQVAFCHEATLRVALRVLSVVVIASSVLALLQFTIGLGNHGPLRIDPHGKRFEHGVGFMNLHLSQGPVMAYDALLLAAASALALVPWRSGVAGVGAAGLAVFLSTARMAYLGLAAGVGAALAARGLRHVARAALYSSLIAGLAISVLYVWQPVRTARALHGDDGRWLIWRTSMRMIEVHPLIGSGGPEGFKAEYSWQFPLANPGGKNEFIVGGAPHAHNSFLSIAAEHGLPALILYLGMIALALRGCWRRRQASPMGWQLGVAVVVAATVAGMFENLAGHSVPAYAFFLVLAISSVLPARPAQTAGLRTP